MRPRERPGEPRRGRLTWILGAIGLAGFVAYLRRRNPLLPAPPDTRAEDLRRTLEESRASTDQATPAGPEHQSADDLTTRRRGVHERGRSALDEMGPPSAE